MDVEKANHSRNRTCCCIGTTICIIIAIVILILILAFTVFKPKRPVISYNNMSVKDLDVSFDITKFKVYLNVTLDVDLSVKNPNEAGFKYSDSTAFINYRGQLVGEVPIPADQISAGETKAMNVSLTLLADRLLSNSDIYSDVKSGVVPLNSYIRLPGKVKILGFKIHAVSTSSCDFSVYTSNRTIGDQSCQYKTKL
ncbi:hypothetical protein ACB092_09G110400 [Castanea dentata]